MSLILTWRAAFVCLMLSLFWFYRFEPDGRQVQDGGLVDPQLCEAMAARYGSATILLSVRDAVNERGEIIGRWQRACFEGPDTSVLVVRPK